MRLKSLLFWEICFQAKYGFYFLYGIITIIYAMVLFAMPERFRGLTAAILIFSDPASMGLFFMGAVVLLEKSQRTPCALAVSPVRVREYVFGKVAAFAAISQVVALALAVMAGVKKLWLVLPGTFIFGVMFTLCGIIIATRISSLNQFILWTVPVEIICYVPALLHLFGVTPETLAFYPINACMDMISGKTPSVIGLLSVLVLVGLLWIYSEKSVRKMWNSMGGVKL